MQFFGAQNDEALNKIILASFRKENIACRIFSKLSLSELHRQLSKADFMFVTKYGDFNGFIPVKVFDYYNLGKPILNFPSDKGEIENFILSTNSGWAFSDGEDCYNALSMAIARKVNGEAIFNMNHRIDSSFYTREHQASILANHLNELISHAR
jgi:hypothetical protein